MNTTTNIDLLSAFIFIGVYQGLILSFFFILKPSAKTEANRYQGLLLLSLALCILEQFLNITGYIVKVLPITNYSEPINLTIGPFLYLYIKRSLNPAGSKKEWIHLILFFIYLGYLCFDLVQPNEFKYNTYLYSFHPDWTPLDVQTTIPNDPLNIKKYLNLITAIHITFYITLSFLRLKKKAEESGEGIFKTDDEILRSMRNLIFHIATIIVIFILVKLNFYNDMGDYFIGIYVSVFIMITTYRIMNDSSYFDRSISFMDITVEKYSKSSLNETGKQKILTAIILELETNDYFRDNLASLSELAKKIGASPHHVSQVINEKLNKSFFELLASYRVEDAKRIIAGDRMGKLTVEEISEMVGYNSKTAFNNSFKKISGKTPSEFRKSLNI